MSIGTTIKKLRREREMTQEQLAEYLGISACAISQWECDRTAPDISQIPLLVRIFGVTSDELLGINAANKEAEIERLREEIYELIRVGKHREGFELAEKAHKMYPDSYELMYMYASHFSRIYYDKSFPDDEKKKLLAECIKLLEAILAGCTDEELRLDAMGETIWMYRESGQLEKAMETASKFPIMCQSSPFQRVAATSGDKRIKAHRSLCFELIEFLSNRMTLNYKDDSGERCYTSAERCKLFKKRIALLELMFEDGDFGFCFDDLREANMYIASYYAKEGDAEKTMLHLEKAAASVISYMSDYYQKDYTHTSILFKGYETSGKDIWYQSNDNDASNLLSEMKKPHYDFIRNDERFTAIEEKLAPYAGKWE